ncbi:universal stress protein [Streptomyces regalis]|uniref:UspA domain-containing protein n=1 Tax=Streptomyces regalis TaxID=68262 RepID=A0A101JD41_9ACTN|nr:universal stress protein [Streptomyces regalis]KUL24589.1 hypothetical protein ADL12_36305 [Streptomyces regalis]
MSGPVVVGVDRTWSSATAVEVAAREAERRGVGLRPAYALSWPSRHVPSGVPPWDPDGADLRDLVNSALTAAERRARSVAPTVEITHEVLVGDPGTVLEAASRHASLTVVGSRRRSRLGRLLPGSAAGRLVAHGRCPVLVVHEGSPAERGVAARFAFAEASARGADLVALRAHGPWTVRSHHEPAVALSGTYDEQHFGDHAKPVPDGALSTLREKYPNVRVHRRQVRGRTSSALVDASAEAGLVVVGAPGRDGIAGLLTGSTSQTLLRHARCPVAVVRSGKD